MATYTTASGIPIFTGAGDDIIDGNDLTNTIFAGNGTNLVRTGKSADVVFAGTGNDFIDAGDGNNTIDAGSGSNRVLSGKGNDTIIVGSGKSTVYSGAGNDNIIALNGNSIINAGIGKDNVALGNGNNKIILEGGYGDVTITGFDIAKDKLRLGQSLLGKSLKFVTSGSDTLVMNGSDLLATLKGVGSGSAALVETAPLYSYKATELGSFNNIDPNASVLAAAINDFGQIAGRYNTAHVFFNQNATTGVQQSNFIRQGFIWEKGKLTALTNVGIKKGQSDLGEPDGTKINMLVANVRNISDRGVVLGTVDEIRQPIPLATDRALAWEQDSTGKYKLTISDFGGLESYFFDTNNSNQIVGRNILSDGYEKTIVVENGVVKELAALGGDGGTAQGINTKGQIVGYVDSDGALNGTEVSTAILWEKDATGTYKLKNLGTFGEARATLRDINDAGQIIGANNNGLSGAAAASNPFLLQGTKFTKLGSLGGKTGSANGINSFGSVVGASQLADGTNHAYIWSNGVMTDLNSLVSPITFNGAAVTLTSAVSINNFGDIAATGSFRYVNDDGATVTGTRAYELKGIAFTLAPTQVARVVAGNTPNIVASALLKTTSNSVAKEIGKVNSAIAGAGNSVKVADTHNVAQLTTGGISAPIHHNSLFNGGEFQQFFNVASVV